ncbi:trafficking protein Mon1-domain-containing protein [Coniella lustricola]|uniref:Vacuolar fusion protein MON1 n=1 Tax=Coniella lustricola TaxID=2025994 RepID=A0A2T3AD72_9PEZI|nr:trafficking protein Mon1-domain-containing protein [Coniella lustricola]
MVHIDDGAGRNEIDERPPPLPPRRASVQIAAKATTAISPIDIQTLSFPDGSRGTFEGAATADPGSKASSGHATPVELGGFVPGSAMPGRLSDAGDDSISVMSFALSTRPPADLASLVASEMNKKSKAWALLRSQSATVQPFEKARKHAIDGLGEFESEFAEIPSEGELGDDARLLQWRSKLKHYMILSSAGKPIWSRHGDLSLINSSMGVVQTIISFYEGMQNPLQGFTAGNTRFVVATEGPLYFVAISRLGESDLQLRDQLKALYMQILSTLTLPTLTKIFVNRPSTDLRRPLQGTEGLLSSLADSFTKGSPISMLGALECLRLRKSQRHALNNAFLKCKTDKLLYGLIVAGGKLVSVIRPRRHSLHPSDLQLIFNMLFESGGIKAGGGENWVPLCLPAFNSSGYLYMYVSFFDEAAPRDGTSQAAVSSDEQIAIILISPDRESFFDLKDMRDNVSLSLKKNGHLDIIKAAVKAGRSRITSIAPGTQISHFLYKSRANVQFCINSGLVPRRRLMTLYHQLHASVHARHSHLKILHCIDDDATSLAWVTPIFEFYCVAGPNASRGLMTQGANKIVQWAKKEEERLFIIGGGVF